MTKQEPKYTLSDLNQEDQDTFMKSFNELLNAHSVYFEPIPQYTRKSAISPWEVTCSILLQKKNLIEDSVEEEETSEKDA